MDKMDEIINRLEELINEKDSLISKLTENLTTQHKNTLKYKNKLFELCKKLSSAKICLWNLGIILDKSICKNPCSKKIIECYKDWVNNGE